MKKKIIGIYVCMLVIATAIPAVIPVKNSEINTIALNHIQASVAGFWTEEQKLLPSDGEPMDYFGYFSVSIDGDTAIIGSVLDDDQGSNSGSAYVFTRTGTTWTQTQKILASDGAQGDTFGWSIALDNDTALIAADQEFNQGCGKVYVFTRTGVVWTQQAILLPPNGSSGDRFGYKVTIDGDTALIGAIYDDEQGTDAGAAYVFTRAGTTWSLQQKLLASDGAAGDYFGVCVSLEHDTAFIGAHWDDDVVVDSGSVYVFTRNGTTWTQTQKILAPDGDIGDRFGIYVSLSGDSVLIGANRDDDNGNDAGAAYIYTRSGTTWTQQAKLLASDGAADDWLGVYASLSGDTALIGAGNHDDLGLNSGAAYVFTRTGTTWTQQQKLLASDGWAGDQFGFCVAFDDNTAIIGAYGDDDHGTDSGSAYVFTQVGLTVGITGGLGVTLKITNNGAVNATNVPWQFDVKGGILGLINKTMNGTVNISTGATVTVETIKVFGLGPITITAKVADEETTVEGTQILIFSIVKK